MNKLNRLWSIVRNPLRMEEYKIPMNHGHLRVQKLTKRSSMKSFFQTSLFKTAGPMITFTAFAGVLCYWIQSERTKDITL